VSENEARALKEGLQKRVGLTVAGGHLSSTRPSEDTVQKVRFKLRVDAGWCRAVAGDERELTEREVAMLQAAHPGCLSVLAAPKAAPIEDEETEVMQRGEDDVPGAPPMDRQHSRRRTVRKRK
jgi:hypothetical protein